MAGSKEYPDLASQPKVEPRKGLTGDSFYKAGVVLKDRRKGTGIGTLPEQAIDSAIADAKSKPKTT